MTRSRRMPPTAAQAAVRAWTRREIRIGRKASIAVVGIGATLVVLALVQAWCIALVLGPVIARAAGTPAGRAVTAHPWAPLSAFTLASLLRAALGFAGATASASLGADARRRLRSSALHQVVAAGPAGLRANPTGALVALLVDQVEALDGFFARWLPASSLATIGPVLVLLAVLPTDPRAALVLLLAGLAVPILQAVFGIGAAGASKRQFTALSRLQVRFLDRMRGIGTIVLAGAADREAASLAVAADELRRRTMRILAVAFLSATALDAAAVTALVAIAVLDRHRLLDRPTAIGAARALFALLVVPEFFAPLRAFALAYQDKHRLQGAAEAIDGLPRPRETVAGPVVAAALPAVRTVEARGVTVAFEDVRFGWDPDRPPVLEALSFRVPAGETAILVGPSGAGKSTVIEILLGFVRPSAGRVTVNGAPLDSIVPAALSRLTAWIGQRPVLFAGTIRENVRFARPDATELELLEAVRAARLDALAARLPDGLDTPIGEGGHGLSGGEAQRVAIARAFLRDAPLLLLDEPTSHLDPATERELLDSLRRLALGRTVILASHSTAAHEFGGRRIDLASRPVDPAVAVPA